MLLSEKKKYHQYLCLVFLSILNGCSGETSYSLSDLNTSVFPDVNNSTASNEENEETSIVIRQGHFLDVAVEGLEYTHDNNDTNITGKGGLFYHSNSEKLTFHIGALELGTTNGAYIVTPREMAKGTSELNSTVINNRVRLLLALDSDFQRFGIQISDSARQSAVGWNELIDFTKTEEEFLSEIQTATNGDISQLPDKDSALTHIESTIQCAYSGAYQGTWSIPNSNQSGYFGVMVRADSDVIVMGDGQTVNDQNNSVMYVVGKADVHKKEYKFDGATYYYDRTTGSLEQGNASDNITGIGKYISYNYMTGSFSNNEVNGSYHATKSDASRNPAYRFTGLGRLKYDDNKLRVVGMIIMDFDTKGKVTGKIHDIRNTQYQPDINGVIDYSTGDISFEVQMPDNVSYVTGNIDLDKLLDTSTLSWHDQNNSKTYGTVEINGCQLQAID